MYDFDTPVCRRGTDSLKWDVEEGELPMWVADMDFQTAPEIIGALHDRVDHGVFGYANVTKEWYEAYISWWSRRHDFTMDKDWMIFCTGVVPAISSIVRKLTTPNENVVIQTPVYNIFFNSIINNGCRVLESPLRYREGSYTVDFDDLEQKLADPQTTLMILCNPHNPVGKIWERETLKKIGSLCRLHHVTVISDEIHCDLTVPDRQYIPFASVSEDCRMVSITALAPTKTFNLAGLQTAAVCVPDPVLRHKVWRGLNTDEVAEPNSFACLATVTAFGKGEPWLEELRRYLAANRRLVEEFVADKIQGLKVVHGEATYLVWLDANGLFPEEEGAGAPAQGVGGRDATSLAEELRDRTGLYLSDGAEYGEAGKRFLRMNVACPRTILMEGLNRLQKGVEQFVKDHWRNG